MQYQLIFSKSNTYTKHVKRQKAFKYYSQKSPSKGFFRCVNRNLQNLRAINLSNLWE